MYKALWRTLLFAGGKQSAERVISAHAHSGCLPTSTMNNTKQVHVYIWSILPMWVDNLVMLKCIFEENYSKIITVYVFLCLGYQTVDSEASWNDACDEGVSALLTEMFLAKFLQHFTLLWPKHCWVIVYCSYTYVFFKHTPKNCSEMKNLGFASCWLLRQKYMRTLLLL